jgi:hypothetical protein
VRAEEACEQVPTSHCMNALARASRRILQPQLHPGYTTLDVSDNRLAGPVADVLAGLRGIPSLQQLNLSFNQFNGSLATSYTAPAFESLVALHLNNNAISGRIRDLDFASLATLDVSANANLTGSLPVSMAGLLLLIGTETALEANGTDLPSSLQWDEEFRRRGARVPNASCPTIQSTIGSVFQLDITYDLGRCACDPGFSGVDGICSACGPGTYSGTAGASSCSSCAVGSAAGSPGSTACVLCPKGAYAPGNGSIYCTPCPINTHQNLVGRTDCYPCQPRQYQNRQGAVECRSCGQEEYPADLNASASDAVCRPCPEGADCSEAPARPIFAKQGWWQEPASANFFKCPHPSACPFNSTASERCSEGYGGPVCAICQERYFHTAFGCAQCASFSTAAVVVLVVLMLLLVLGLVVLYIRRRRAKKSAAGIASRSLVAAESKRGKMVALILVGFSQVLGSLGNYQIPFPEFFADGTGTQITRAQKSTLTHTTHTHVALW